MWFGACDKPRTVDNQRRGVYARDVVSMSETWCLCQRRGVYARVDKLHANLIENDLIDDFSICNLTGKVMFFGHTISVRMAVSNRLSRLDVEIDSYWCM